MPGNKRQWLQIIRTGFVCLVILFVPTVIAWAQTNTPVPWLRITGSNISSPPAIEIHVVGMDENGRSLDLSQTPLDILHNGQSVGPGNYAGTYTAGTFTVFLIDIPAGVAEQFPAIQDTILQFASPGNMQEETDAIAIYQVGETAAIELLSPTFFYNSVRNLFATPLTPATGATALIDSTMGLLEQLEELKPNPEMSTALVIISDGTDVVSTRFQHDDVAPRAATLGIPIHTIWLTNNNLLPATQTLGRDYLQELAAGSRGLSASLDNPAEITAIWERILSFREQARILYTPEFLAGGSAQVTVMLAQNPLITAETTIEIPENLPSVVIDLPLESRVLSLPDLEKPIRLRFRAHASWLDEEERALVAAQLMVNGEVVQDIPVESLDSFTAEIDNLTYGNNIVQIAALDNQGIRVTSPPVVLTVNEGTREIPPELAAGGGLGQILATIGIAVLVLGVVAGLGYAAWQTGVLGNLEQFLPRGRSTKRAASRTPAPETAVSDTPATTTNTLISPHTPPIAHLEVLESVSRMPAQIPLTGTLVKIGRSPAQADIAFENDITVSRLHATLMLEGTNYRIYDERSTSGTWVNDQQVPEYGIQLVDGDEIHLGAVHLRYRQP